MNWIFYIVIVGVVFSLLYAIYFFLFRKNTYFQINRFYLIGIIPLSFILPIINFNTVVNSKYQIKLPTVELIKTQIISQSFNWGELILFFYIGVSSLFGLFLIYKTGKTLQTISRIKSNDISGVKPFSFFRFIHVPETIEKQHIESILNHEKVHSTQLHSLDIYVYELTKVVLWWNPFIWMGIKSVKNNHEFIADKLASEKSNQYSCILIAQLLGVNCSELANNFNYEPFIKKRVMMMKTKKSNRLSVLKYALAIPVIAVSLAATTNAQLEEILRTPSETTTEINIGEVDLMPEFKGGMEQLMKYMGETVKYPKESEKNGDEGMVYVSFLVGKTGEIKNVKVIKSATPLLDAEAVRVISEMPNWKPGMSGGKPVEVEMTLPIKFQL